MKRFESHRQGEISLKVLAWGASFPENVVASVEIDGRRRRKIKTLGACPAIDPLKSGTTWTDFSNRDDVGGSVGDFTNRSRPGRSREDTGDEFRIWAICSDIPLIDRSTGGGHSRRRIEPVLTIFILVEQGSAIAYNR